MPTYNAQQQELQKVLHTAFDATYLALLETNRVTLDDELQGRLRETLVTEVFGVLSAECERMGKGGKDVIDHFCKHGFQEIERRLSQEISAQEEEAETSVHAAHGGLGFLPSLEGAPL